MWERERERERGFHSRRYREIWFYFLTKSSVAYSTPVMLIFGVVACWRQEAAKTQRRSTTMSAFVVRYSTSRYVWTLAAGEGGGLAFVSVGVQYCTLMGARWRQSRQQGNTPAGVTFISRNRLKNRREKATESPSFFQNDFKIGLKIGLIWEWNKVWRFFLFALFYFVKLQKTK